MVDANENQHDQGDSAPPLLPPRFRLIGSVFVRVIAAIYLVAFLSANVQMLGLYGHDGISPVDQIIKRDGEFSPILAQFGNPTIFWFDCSDAFLVNVTVFGAIVSLLALCGILAGPCLLIAWFLYLSIVTVGQEFMSFQWDILLLETGFLTIFFAPWKPFDFLFSKTKWKLPSWSINRAEASNTLIWLYRWLLFRLMFASGVVKLQSGDPTWHNLTAMTFHYETQPLPTPAAFFVHQLPQIIQIASCAGVFFFELLVPFMIFGNRRIREIGALLLIFLQVSILVTGNYCFFNVLTIALCLLLFDDASIEGAVHFLKLNDRFKGLLALDSPPPVNRLRRIVIIPLTVLILTLSGSGTLITICGVPTESLPMPAIILMAVFNPWNLVSNYGLFAVMTTTRPEIIVEGSVDGDRWTEYTFKYKPGPLDRAPPIVAPHQPRLDWQMWFASLGNILQNQWFLSFAEKLMNNSPAVTGLLENNPFEKEPPNYIRANVYDYHFSDVGTLFKTGKWWTRKFKEEYLPPISREKEL